MPNQFKLKYFNYIDIGAPPSREQHSTSLTEEGLGGRMLQVVMVLLVVVCNVSMIWASRRWGGRDDKPHPRALRSNVRITSLSSTATACSSGYVF